MEHFHHAVLFLLSASQRSAPSEIRCIPTLNNIILTPTFSDSNKPTQYRRVKFADLAKMEISSPPGETAVERLHRCPEANCDRSFEKTYRLKLVYTSRRSRAYANTAPESTSNGNILSPWSAGFMGALTGAAANGR